MQQQAEARPDRAGKKAITIWTSPDTAYALKLLALERRITLRELLIEFLGDGLEKCGKARTE
jgi:hypothetical protein